MRSSEVEFYLLNLKLGDLVSAAWITSLITHCKISRYTHVEAECPDITFEGLLDRLEDLVCDVVDRLLASPAGELIKKVNKHGFQAPKRPFKRMDYTEAIKYLKEHNITKDDGIDLYIKYWFSIEYLTLIHKNYWRLCFVLRKKNNKITGINF